MKNVILVILFSLRGLNSLQNGVAFRPPMGWSSWTAFGCRKCNSSGDTQCLSEAAIKKTAQILVDEGYSQLGYRYVIIDDCWQSPERDDKGKLQADETRFPNGIRALSKYVHEKKLKLGIFSSLGKTTGAGFPGSANNYEKDANTFAKWEVDYVKISATGVNPDALDREYPEFGYYLAKTGRPMLYASSWMVYQDFSGLRVNYESLPLYCNTWRFGNDASPSWSSILQVMDQYRERQSELVDIGGRGAWSDADVLVIGKDGITLDQSKAQMAVWSIMASPLILSTDLSKMKPEFKAVLQNKNMIAIHQDRQEIPGYSLGTQNNIETWIRPISPITDEDYSYAIAFVNRNPSGNAVSYTTTLENLGLQNASGYLITDLFPTTPGIVTYNRQQMNPDSVLQMNINPSGVAFFKAEVIASKETLNSRDTLLFY